MAIGMGLVDIGGAQRRDPILEHALAVAIDQTHGKAQFMIFPGDHSIDAVFDKKIRPLFQPVVVDAMGVFGHQGFDAMLADEV